VDAAVIGAGIGGLAAGIALRAAGVSVLVYESDERLRPVGAGLSIWPNGVKALRALGLGQIAADAPRGGGALRRADGTELAAFDPDTIADRYGAPLVALDRGVLHAALLAGLGQDRLRMGTRAIGLDEDVVRFADGSEARPACGRSSGSSCFATASRPTRGSSPSVASATGAARCRPGSGGGNAASRACCRWRAAPSTGTSPRGANRTLICSSIV
jgi:hypothetical protein